MCWWVVMSRLSLLMNQILLQIHSLTNTHFSISLKIENFQWKQIEIFNFGEVWFRFFKLVQVLKPYETTVRNFNNTKYLFLWNIFYIEAESKRCIEFMVSKLSKLIVITYWHGFIKKKFVRMHQGANSACNMIISFHLNQTLK